MIVEVSDLHHDGVVVRTFLPGEDVHEYWLPASEWGGDPDTWEKARECLEPGQELDVVLLPGRPDHEGLPIVSARAFNRSHVDEKWGYVPRVMRIESISQTLIRGHVGNIPVVMSRYEYNTFLDQFSHNDHFLDHGALTEGQYLPGVVRSLAGPENRILLSIEDYLRQSIDAVHKKNPHVQPVPKSDEEIPRATALNLPKETVHAISPFLLVENDSLCLNSWSELLRREGVDVTTAASREEAELLLQKTSDSLFRMALIDVHLDENENHDGFELAQWITEISSCRVLLTSGESLEEKIQKWGFLKIYGFIPKPCLIEDLSSAFETAVSLGKSEPLAEWSTNKKSEQIQGQSIKAVKEHKEVTLVSALQKCRDIDPSISVYLFQLHPRSWRGKPLASVGNKLNWEPFRGKLGLSIIKDAADSYTPIIKIDCTPPWRHFWTSKMIAYNSFWGVRLDIKSHYRYTLVAFHPRENGFIPNLKNQFLVCAEQVTRILERERIERQAVYESKNAVFGLGFACLAHEIYSKLSGAAGTLALVADDLNYNQGLLEENKILDIRSNVNILRSQYPEMVEVASILRGTGAGVTSVSVHHCLQKAINGIRASMRLVLMKPDNLSIEDPKGKEDDNGPFIIETIPAAIVTVFYNVLLNAAQQIERIHAIRSHGRIWTSINHYIDDRRLPWAIIYIQDTGPGIPVEEWERIFDPGFSTKPDGTGLGLHICRQLLNEICDGNRQASIKVTHSALWGGSTFTIRLPLS